MDSVKGPWMVGELVANDGGIAVLSDEGRVCLVDAVSPVKRGQGWLHQDEDRNARARLIAAAPDLLDALRVALAQLEESAGGSSGMKRFRIMDAVNVSRSAIAKAKGS